jgi:hypothetical protein
LARVGSTKAADKTFAIGRLRKARAYQRSLEKICRFADDIGDTDVIYNAAIMSAIAYTDAMTAAIDGRKNQKNHQDAPKLLKDALGNALPSAQYRRLVNLLGMKDQVSYGAGTGHENPADIVENLARFADFAEEILIGCGIEIINEGPTKAS